MIDPTYPYWSPHWTDPSWIKTAPSTTTNPLLSDERASLDLEAAKIDHSTALHNLGAIALVVAGFVAIVWRFTR